MTPPRIALATAIAAFAADADLAPLQEALRSAGAHVEALAWDDPTVSWTRFDAVVLRSTWDYAERRDEFLAWCQRTHHASRLFNPPDVVRWNTDKHYLGELADAGVPVIASHFIEPDGDPDAFPQLAEFVVKPAVGAGSRDVQRYTAAQRGDAVDHVRRLLRQHRSALVQPYVAGVDAHGESALVFIDGHFSHALRKNALLQPGAAASQALFAPASIGPREATTEELGVARQVLAALPFGPQLYARVDLLPSPAGPLLLELELTEPSLFFVHAPEAATALAHALLARLDAAVRSTGTVVSPAAARPAG